MTDDHDILATDAGKSRRLHRVRQVVVLGSLALMWALTLPGFATSDTEVYVIGQLAIALGLAVITATWIASLRWERLRRALLPFEGGLVVAAGVFLFSQPGLEIDTNDDRIFVAGTFGVGAALVLAFAQPIVAGRRRGQAWLVGIVAIAIGIGTALPPALDWVIYSDDERWTSADERQLRHAETARRITEPGFQLSSSDTFSAQPSLELGYEPHVSQSPGFAELALGDIVGAGAGWFAANGVGVDPAGGPIRPAIHVRTWLVDERTVRLRVSELGAGPVALAVRRGDCSVTSPDDELLRLDLRDGADVEQRIDLGPAGLGAGDQLRLLIADPRPLGPVRCVPLVDPLGLRLLAVGDIAFHEECIEPLGLARAARAGVTPSTFEDPGCADRFERLAMSVGSARVPVAAVDGVRSCLEDKGIRVGEQVDLTDGSALLFTQPRAHGGYECAASDPVAVPVPLGLP
jgi:hypothetical protein